MVKSAIAVTIVIKHVNAMENRAESNKKSSAKCDMGYNIVEDIKKTKANIYLFEMCKWQVKTHIRNFF